jgi:hypothetical protein
VRHPPTADLEALIRALVDAGIEFVVVRGAAAVIHGAPVTTQDLDIVPRQHPGDVERLLVVLSQLDARFRPVRRIATSLRPSNTSRVAVSST